MFFEDEVSKRRKIITEDEKYKEFERSLNVLIDFMWSLSDLISWNGHVIAISIEGKKFILQTELIDSAVRTLFSIKICSQNGLGFDSLLGEIWIHGAVATVLNYRDTLQMIVGDNPLEV